jgi:hypothetical protein
MVISESGSIKFGQLAVSLDIKKAFVIGIGIAHII